VATSNKESGIYLTPVEIELYCPLSGSSVYYTTNSSDPLIYGTDYSVEPRVPVPKYIYTIIKTIATK